MEIYTGGRGQGKTLKAIQLSAEKQMPIVCFSYHQMEYIKYRAKEMNLKMPKPIMFDDVRGKVIGNRRELIVDNLDFLLRRLFDDEVHYATMRTCNITRVEKES